MWNKFITSDFISKSKYFSFSAYAFRYIMFMEPLLFNLLLYVFLAESYCDFLETQYVDAFSQSNLEL